MKLILKGCPRCGGDLMPDRWDLEGEDLCCVQCGHAAPAALLRRAAVPQVRLAAMNPSYETATAQRKVA
jgi:hypothetical protein